MISINKLSQDSLEQNLNSIYECSLNPNYWRECLKGIAQCINAKSGMVGTDDIITGTHLSRIQYGYDKELVKRVTGELRGQDVWTKALIELKPKGFVSDTVLLATDGWSCRGDFLDILSQHDIHHTAGAYADFVEHMGIRIAFQRASSQGYYSERETHYLDALLPHIKQSLRLSKLLCQDNLFSSVSICALEQHADGVLLTTAVGKVVFANQKALELCSTNNRIDITSGYLTIKDISPIKLQSSIASVCRKDRLEDLENTYDFILKNESQNSHHVCLCRFQENERVNELLFDSSNQALAMVLIRPMRSNSTNWGKLNSLYGLTQQEIQVAKYLTEGKSPREISDARQRSIDTIRTQIKQVTYKVGAKSINDLVYKLNVVLK